MPTKAQNAANSPSRTTQRGPDALRRLILITQSNDRLATEMAKSRRHLQRALDYATDPKCNATLGVALIAHCQRKHDRLVEQFRANRSEAIAVLAEVAGRS